MNQKRGEKRERTEKRDKQGVGSRRGLPYTAQCTVLCTMYSVQSTDMEFEAGEKQGTE